MKNFFIKYIGLFLFAGIFIFVLAGCDENPTDIEDYEPEPMLSAYIYNGEPVTEVFLEWTDYFLGSYNRDDQAILAADIRVYPVNADGTLDSANVIQLMDDPATLGKYISTDMNQLIAGLETYKIVVNDTINGFELTSTTTVPGDFDLYILPPDSINFQLVPQTPNTLQLPNSTDSLTREAPQILLAWNPPDSNAGYIVNYICLVDTVDLVPLDPDFIIGEDEVESEDKARFNLDFLLKDQDFYTMPWLIFNWVGTYEITFMATCFDYFNYVNYGMTVMMGQTLDLPTNITGGQGIFGGLNRYTFKVTLKRID